MAYHYKLEQIRHLRERERHLAQWKYLDVLHKLKEAENQLSAALEKESEAAHLSRAGGDRARSVQNIQDCQNYLDSIRQRTRQCQSERDRLQQKVQTEQSALRERRITEQMMNKLRQNDYAKYCLEQKRKDQGLMDEIAVSRYGRGG